MDLIFKSNRLTLQYNFNYSQDIFKNSFRLLLYGQRVANYKIEC